MAAPYPDQEPAPFNGQPHSSNMAAPNFEVPLNFSTMSSPQDFDFGLTDSGPQQTRKLPASDNDQPQQPSTFDPRALLNPKAGQGSSETPQNEVDTAESTQNNGGIGQMIETLNGVRDREDAPVRKRKVQANEDGESEDERKKPKSSFKGPSGGGVISTHMKEQRANADLSESGPASASAGQTIDLTNDDDDVQYVKSSPKERERESTEEVYLGDISSSANAFTLPIPTPGAQKAIGNDHWPRMKIKYKKASSDPKNMTIELYHENNKFGTLEPKLASGLVPMLAGVALNGIRVQMIMPSRRKRPGDILNQRISQSIKLEVRLFAPRNKADSILRFLSQKQLFPRNSYQNTGRDFYDPLGPRNYGRQQLVQGQNQGSRPSAPMYTVTRTQEEMRRETDALFDKLNNQKEEDLPKMEPNKDIIASELLGHQKQALHFLTEHERNDFQGNELPPHSLWEYKPKDNGKASWYHKITFEETLAKPSCIQGGILADVMGLGKTLSILALVAHTQDEARQFRAERPPRSADVYRNARSTLIICPKSVMSNWAEQIATHTVQNKMRVYQYHGSNRMQDLDKLSRYDIVLTTYNIAASEFSDKVRKKAALNSINWFRIVLDEAHSIRTTDTKMSKACCALEAQRRWAVTGTPVQNHLNDLGSLIKFIRLQPFDNPNKWTQYIMSPFKTGDVDVIQKLQILVRTVTLRRGKGTVGLPERHEAVVKLKFNSKEASLYRQFAATGRTQLQNISQGGTVLKGKAYAHVLKSIGRLRAICAHGREMITDEDLKEVEGDDPDNAIVLDLGDEPELEGEDEFVTEKQAYETFTMMADSDVSKCASCNRKLEAERSQPDAAGVVDLTSEDDSSSEDPSNDVEREEDEVDEEEEEHDETDGPEHSSSHAHGDLIANLTPCYHLICSDCTDKHIKLAEENMTADGYHYCPYCAHYMRFGLFPIRRSVLRQFVKAREEAKKVKAAKWDETTYSGPHTKVKALLEELKESARETAALPEDAPPVRSVVFSGWTAYLDLIEYALTQNNIHFTRIDGAMSVKQRSNAIHLFNTDPSVTVLIVSIKAGGQGLNFTAANKAYVMEPQFNPGVEQQAVDRVHRIGQTRDVMIKHFIMEDSIEEAILSLQKKKEKLAQMSMDKKRSKADENKERIMEIQALFK